jgi:hypothetical protein
MTTGLMGAISGLELNAFMWGPCALAGAVTVWRYWPRRTPPPHFLPSEDDVPEVPYVRIVTKATPYDWERERWGR